MLRGALALCGVVLGALVLVACTNAGDDPDAGVPQPNRRFDAGSGADAGGARAEAGEREEQDAGRACPAGLTACGATCVDLQTAASSCGGCGVTCVIPHASAACVDGACALMACEPGRFDLDGELDNGCEVVNRCEPGASCMTSCGSQGATTCDGPVASCSPPAEVCNSADDDCDGQCDEDAGCRVGVFRSFGGSEGHLYTTDRGVASAAPFNIEFEGYFHLYTAQVPGTRPAFLCAKRGGGFFLTASTNCESTGAPRATLGYWASGEQCGAVPLYRLRRMANHFYTVSAAERDNAINTLDYVSEGIAGWVWR